MLIGDWPVQLPVSPLCQQLIFDPVGLPINEAANRLGHANACGLSNRAYPNWVVHLELVEPSERWFLHD